MFFLLEERIFSLLYILLILVHVLPINTFLAPYTYIIVSYIWKMHFSYLCYYITNTPLIKKDTKSSGRMGGKGLENEMYRVQKNKT